MLGGKTRFLGKLRFGLAILGRAVDGDDTLVWDGARGGISGVGRDHQDQEGGEGRGAAELHYCSVLWLLFEERRGRFTKE